MIQMGYHTVRLMEIGGDITQGTIRSSLDVRRGFRVLFQAKGGGTDHTEIVQVRIHRCPEINMGMDRIRITNEALRHGEGHDIGMEEDERADTMNLFRVLLGDGRDIVPCASQEPEIPGVLVLEKRGLNQAVGPIGEARRDHRIVFKDQTERSLIIHHPLPDRNVRKSASHSSNGVQLLMGSAGLGEDVTLRHRTDALLRLEIQRFSVHAEEAFYRDLLDTGLSLEALPSIQTTLQRDTESGDVLDAPCGL